MLAADVLGSLLLGAAIVVVLALIGIVVRRRGRGDGVDSFRRQIDALSPAARRSTVDQIKNKPGKDADGAAGGDA